MHVISSKEETIHLWLNSKHKKSDNKLQISLGNASAESVVAGVATLTKGKNNMARYISIQVMFQQQDLFY